MQVNLNSAFALKISALGSLLVVHAGLTQKAVGNLVAVFEACAGNGEILAKLRSLHAAALIGAEKAGRHSHANWMRTVHALQDAIKSVQGDEQAWTADVVRLAGAESRAALRWSDAGLKASLHSHYAYGHTVAEAAESIRSVFANRASRAELEVA